MIGEEPWFVGKDVAEALGHSNARDAISKHVDAEDKGVAKCDTLGGTQDLTVINESGVYALVFGSKLESGINDYGIRNGGDRKSDGHNVALMSQSDLANKLGVTQKQLQRYKSLTKLIPELH